VDQDLVAKRSVKLAVLAGQRADVPDFIRRICKPVLLASALGAFDKRFGRIDSDNSPTRPDNGVKVSMGGGIPASGFQDRPARRNTEVSQHPLPRVPECGLSGHGVKDVTDTSDWLRRQFI
jgi:hypothetical protein